MSLRNKLTILTVIISVLIGPVEFIVSVLISSYTKGFPDSWTWLDFFNPWFMGFFVSSFVFDFLAIWIIYGIVWAICQIISFKKNLRRNSKSKNFKIVTTVISLLLGPVLFVVETCIYGIRFEHWFIVGIGNFVSIFVYGFVFTWFIYAFVRWIILPPCYWFAKLIGIHKN